MKPQKERRKELKLRNEIMAKKREKTLWGWFSKYVRLRDCIESGFGPCCSCGKFVYWKDADPGHYISQKNHYSVVYDEMNVHLQCKNCNHHLSGNVAEYRKFLVDKYGEDAIIDLEERSKQLLHSFPRYEVEAMSAKYRQLAKDEAYIQGEIL